MTRKWLCARPPLILLATLAVLCFSAPSHAAPTMQRNAQSSVQQFAFSQNNNVYLMHATGGERQTVTTRGTVYRTVGGIVYPWYSWSPDGRYLLLVKWRTTGSTGILFLLNQQETVLRTLATVPAPADFWPTWAIDADQIAFVAAQRTDQAYGGFRNIVDRMDIGGHRTHLFNYKSHEGCGGGTGDPAEALYWGETGFGGNRLTMTWSMAQGVAAYTASCAGGVNLTDLRTLRTRNFRSWQEPALSTRGALAVAGASFSPDRPSAPSIMIVNPRSGGLVHGVAAGELPAWSPNGKFLYFVHRTPGPILQASDAYRNHRELHIIRSKVDRARADGTHITELYSTDAFGLGTLNVTRDGASLIFSRVDNDWALWRHRQGNVLPATLGRYAPQVRILRLSIGRGESILAMNAGSPVVQP